MPCPNIQFIVYCTSFEKTFPVISQRNVITLLYVLQEMCVIDLLYDALLCVITLLLYLPYGAAFLMKCNFTCNVSTECAQLLIIIQFIVFPLCVWCVCAVRRSSRNVTLRHFLTERAPAPYIIKSTVFPLRDWCSRNLTLRVMSQRYVLRVLILNSLLYFPYAIGACVL